MTRTSIVYRFMLLLHVSGVFSSPSLKRDITRTETRLKEKIRFAIRNPRGYPLTVGDFFFHFRGIERSEFLMIPRPRLQLYGVRSLLTVPIRGIKKF